MKAKRIWLIGASEGIGAALAQHLACQGAHMILSARNSQRLQDVHSSLPGDGHVTLPLDVCDLSGIQDAWRNVASTPPDIVIYNAGAYTPMHASSIDIADVEQMIDVNLRGAFRVVSVVLPALLACDAGHIVLVGSAAGYRGLPSAIGYGASKAGLIHLAENLRADLIGTGIRVQIVNPGFVETRLTKKNTFPMPLIVTADIAARHIVRGMQSSRFEIHFPLLFTGFLKLLSIMPNALYYRLLSAIKPHKAPMHSSHGQTK